MSYTITLTQEDVDTIGFVGHRYCWSDAMSCLGVGDNILEEHVAWEINDAIEKDTEGGHSILPMLNSRSDLYDKIVAFITEIV